MRTDREIVTSYQETKNQKETARILGCSQSHVSAALRRNEIRRKTREQKKDEYLVVKDLWEQYGNTTDVSERTPYARGQISRILREYFDIRVPRGMYNKYDLPMDELAERYQAGETCGDIARSLNLPSERIRRRLKAHGVKIRSVAESVPRGKKNRFYKDGRGNEYRENKYQSKKVATEYLGRPLPVGWVVHHMDENTKNLSPENLYLFPSIACHSTYHVQLLGFRQKEIEVDAIQLVLENGGQALLQHPLRVK
jgi:hypothetical protein